MHLEVRQPGPEIDEDFDVRTASWFMLFMTFGVALTMPLRAASDCPAVTLVCGEVYERDEAQYQTSCTSDLGIGFLDYDLVHGLYGASASSFFPFGMGAGLTARDVYRIEGGTPGTPMPLRVRLEARGYGSMINPNNGCCGGGSSARFRVDGQESPTAFFSCAKGGPCPPPDQVIDLDTTKLVGEPFTVEVLCQAGGSEGGGGGVDAVLSFPDLPAGTVIVSCRGFTTGAPTPVLPATWGELKALYR